MNPSQAMGTFIRTWRAEWAGLSRAQLANAVTARLPQGQKVASHAIRAWESGQPPKSVEELDALCAVMGRHGLVLPETEQFRYAVLTAVCDRHYAALFEPDRRGAEPDIDAFALEALADYGLSLGPAGPVRLVALIAELRNELTRPEGYYGPRQATRQRVALSCLRTILAELHAHYGRNALAAETFAANAAFLLEHFGARACLDDDARVTVLAQRYGELWHRLGPRYVASVGRRPSGGPDGTLQRAACELLRVAEEARARGEDDLSWKAWVEAVNPVYVGASAQPDLHPWLDELADQSLSLPEIVSARLVEIHLGRGLIEEAERYLAVLNERRRVAFTFECLWRDAAASVAFAQGHHAEAEEHLERGLAPAIEEPLPWFAGLFRGRLSACRDGQA